MPLDAPAVVLRTPEKAAAGHADDCQAVIGSEKENAPARPATRSSARIWWRDALAKSPRAASGSSVAGRVRSDAIRMEHDPLHAPVVHVRDVEQILRWAGEPVDPIELSGVAA